MFFIRALILAFASVHALAVGRLGGQQTSCPPLDSTAAWARVNRSWSNESGQTWTNDSLRQVLLSMAARDQDARRDFGAHATDSVYVRRLIALDSVLAAQMTGILATYGLPTRVLVGAAGADAAMLIVQHSWPLQERVLEAAKAVPSGQISPQALAMLEDRVLVHQGKRQRYGTHFNLGPDGIFHLAPTEDLPGLEGRRTLAGILPLPQYVCMLEETGIRVDRGSLPATRPQ